MYAKITTNLGKPMNDTELEQTLYGLVNITLQKGIYLLAFIREAANQVAIVAPPDVLETFTIIGAKPEPFDFESWIKTTNDKVFWMIDYLHGAPKLNRMYR